MINANGKEVYIEDIVPMILSADASELEDIIYYVKCRYQDLFPDWGFCYLSVHKEENRKQHLDHMISVLNKIKEI